jgi:hypothetical protein
MFFALSVVGAIVLTQGDTVRAVAPGPRDTPAGIARSEPADTVPRRKRGKTVQISEAYETRLTIHRIASYATVPLFVAQAFVGQQLYTADKNGTYISDGVRVAHNVIGGTIGALFAVNTVTGGLNWWDMRYQPQGRPWRTVHSALMLAADGGLTYAATMGLGSRFSQADRDRHKNWAIGSAAVALAGYAMMLSPIRRD